MNTKIDKLKSNNGFTINYNGFEVYCEAILKSPGIEKPLIIDNILEDDNNLLIKWNHNEFGRIIQSFTFNQANENNCMASYKLSVNPIVSTDALVIFNFGIAPEKEPYFMIPGHIYGTNNIKNSKSKQPQLNYRGDICYPKTPVIYTRADRSTHNAVLTIANNNILGIRIDESTWEGDTPIYNGLGIDTRNFDGIDRIAVTLGYHHFPVHYYGKLFEFSHTKDSELEYIKFEKGKEYKTAGHIYIAPSENRYGYENAVRYFYNQIHQHPGNKVDRLTAVKDLTHALINDAFSYKYNYFPTVLSGGYSDTGIAGDSGWTGGMQVVYPLLRASKYVDEAKAFTLKYIDGFIKDAINPDSGMFYENKDKEEWKVSGWWRDDLILYNRRLEKLTEAHSAYINGQVTCYILKSFQYARAEGWEHPNLDNWLEASKTILDKVVETQRYDGAFGVYFDSENGEPVYYNSFQGAWFLAAIAELAKITNDKKYTEAIEKADPFYYSFIERVELWGTPIDTRDAVDEEGNLAYITATKTIHEITKDKKWAERLIHALHYEFSWKFAYNTRFANEPLKSMKWSSSGGSITSSHNIHIHQMGNLICEEIYYAYKLTNDEYFLNRLKDTLNWGLGTHNTEDNQFGFGKKGWATEQFFHSDGKQDDVKRVVDGGIWYDYLSWAAACVLLSSCVDIEEEFYLPE